MPPFIKRKLKPLVNRHSKRLPILEAYLELTRQLPLRNLYWIYANVSTDIDPDFEEDKISNYSQYSQLVAPLPQYGPVFTHVMSTRRTTRATSKAASSRGASPAITEADIPATPSARRSSRRAGSATPLPAIASRASTAYGTNTTVQPASLKVPEQGEEIGNALNSILQPQSHPLPAVREEDTPSDAGGKFRSFRVCESC